MTKLPCILHIAPISERKASGPSSSVPGLVGALHRLGIPTGLITTSAQGPYEKPQPFPVFYIKEMPRGSVTRSLPFPLSHPKLLVFHSTYIPEHAVLGYEAYRKKIPYIITPRGGMTRGAQRIKWFKKRIGNLLFYRAFVRHAAALHCLAEREAHDVQAWGRPLFVVGNGIDLPALDHLAQPGTKLGLKFVFVGRLDIIHKGLDLLVQAVSLIQSELSESGSRVILYGPDHKGSKAILKKDISERGITNLVMLKEPVYGDSKRVVMQEADVFMHTSRFEGQPMAVLEALSYGLPCLLTTGTNISSEVAQAKAGWEANMEVESIAETMLKAIKGKHELVDLARSARKMAEDNFSWDLIGKVMLEHYMRIIAK